jgi:DNA repair photolyase
MRVAVEICHKVPKQLITPTGGYLTGYSHTLNPYGGCAFACSYCYVREMPVALFRKQAWGSWVDVKQPAAGQLQKELQRAKKKGPVTIFMSSSTDPYQPIEYKEKVTRSLLEAMVAEKPDFLFVQTRSPLVTRDIDLFAQLKDRILISITVETDLEEMRKLFTPAAPPLQARLQALKQLVAAGLPVQATISPLLPCSPAFAQTLAGIVNRVCIDDFFMGDGKNGKRTEKLRIGDIYAANKLEKWYSKTAYLDVWAQLRQHFAEEQIFVSQKGFRPW